MYWIVDGICFLLGVAQIVLTAINKIQGSVFYGICWIILYPFLLQSLYNILTYLFGQRIEYKLTPRHHLVYRNDYNISFLGLEKCHPFDSYKYGNIYNKLVQSKLIGKQDVHRPKKVSRSLLMQVMSKWYLIKLNYTIPLCYYISVPLFFLPAFGFRKIVLDAMLYATEGTLLSLIIASRMKWAINLSGGYHHASFNGGGGFCIYPDISLAAHYLRTRMGYRRVMIIDCDAHQGNGYQRDFIGDNQTYVIDFYNHRIYPGDQQAKKAISKDVQINSRTTDQQYIALLQDIGNDMDKFAPEFVIYNAGTDILMGDPLGRLNISDQGVIARDQIIFRLCLSRKIPIVMVLSGGYQKINAQIIAQSIRNIYAKFS